MVGFLPRLYEDELLAGGLMRAMEMLHLKQDRRSFAKLFGRMLKLNGALMVTGMRSLSPIYPFDQGPEVVQLLQEHTLLPYLGFFADKAQQSRLILATEESSELQLPFGIGSRLFAHPLCLRACPSCVREDFARSGSSYWRRTHQLPGVLLCPDHGDELRETLHRIAGALFPAGPDPTIANAMGNQLVPDGIREALLGISRDSKALLRTKMRSFDLPKLQKRLRELLVARGYSWARAPSLLDMDSLVSSLMQDQLFRFLAATSYTSERSRLQTALYGLLTNKSKPKFPLAVLVIAHFVGITYEELQASAPAEPDENAVLPTSLPCANPKCSRFEESIGASLAKAGLPKVRHHIRCTHCGLMYSWHIKNPGYVAVLKTGPIWDAALIERLNGRAGSLRRLSKEFGVSVPALKRHALRLGIWNDSWLIPQKTRNRLDRLHHMMARHRSTWVAEKDRGLGVTAKQLTPHGRTAYRFLLKHDRAWLLQHGPLVRKEWVIKADWKKKDADTLARFDQAIVAAAKLGQQTLSVTAVANLAGLKSKLWRGRSLLSKLSERVDRERQRRAIKPGV